MAKLTDFEIRLCDRIEKEHFDMCMFRTDRSIVQDDDSPYVSFHKHVDAGAFSCETASCMGGHIESMDPEMAAMLWNSGVHSHKDIAIQIYEKHTGKPCGLDFFGFNWEGDGLAGITRKDAIEHIQGTHRSWSQIKRNHRK